MLIKNKIYLIFILATLIVLSIISLNLLSNSESGSKSPQTYEINTDIIDEASGIAYSFYHSDVLWTHNDSGDESLIYAINTSGEYLGKIKIEGVENRDWEDIAIVKNSKDNKSYIYIGEIGDNKGIYPQKSIIYFEEPRELPKKKNFYLTLDNYNVINFTFNGKNPDCETLLIDPTDGQIYIISKREDWAILYNIPNKPETENIKAIELGSLKIGNERTGKKKSRIVAGDISTDGKHILLKSYDTVYYYYRADEQSIKEALMLEPKSLPYIEEPQGEAICWNIDASKYYTLSEKNKKQKQLLYIYTKD